MHYYNTSSLHISYLQQKVVPHDGCQLHWKLELCSDVKVFETVFQFDAAYVE